MSAACMKNFVSIIILFLTLYGQSYAQWQKTNFPSTTKVNTIAISDSNIFAGTNGDGIFVSTDNGENWVSINEGLQNKIVHTIFINGTTIFAGTETGASISTNNGLNWSTVNSGLSDKGVWSFAISNFIPGRSTIFAGTWSGIYFSTNDGTIWEATSLSNTTMPVHSIVVHKNFVFAATLAGGVFNSQSNGMVWRDITVKYIDSTTGNTAVIPVYSLAAMDTNVIAGVGSGNIYHTSYDDTLFILIPTVISKNKPILCFSIRNTNLFAGNSDGGILLSEGNGLVGWKPISPSLTHKEVCSLALNKSYIFVGTENGIWRFWYPDATTSANNFKEVPTGFSLEQNYPNPFNSSTKIKFTIPNSSNVSLKVYNMLGELVDNLVDKYMAQGTYGVEFLHNDLPSGIYFYSLIANEYRSTKKLILLK
jgi:hypothetical protein